MSLTPLHEAAHKGDLRSVERLLNNGANVNVVNRKGDTPLHLAALKGHVLITKALINKGADIEAQNGKNDTPLHLASSYGKEETVKSLVEAGATISSKNEEGNTPLHLAATCEIAQILLDHGNEFDINFKNRKGRSILHIVTYEGDMPMVTLLLNNNPNVNVVNMKNDTPLHLASLKGHALIASALIDKGADIEARNHQNKTPLHSAVSYGKEDTVRLLLEAARIQRIPASVYNFDYLGNTAAHDAAYTGHVEIIELLLDYGFDINFQNSEQNTLLHQAVFNTKSQVIHFLLERQANLEIQNSKLETPLHRAIIIGNIDIIEILLTAGGNMYNLNETGNTGAHHSAFNGELEIIKLLFERGFDINIQSEKKHTLLHLAAREGHIQFVDYLISKRANLDVINQTGNLAITLAARLGYTNVVIKLLEAGAKTGNLDTGYTILHAAATGNRLHTLQTVITKFPNKFDIKAKWQDHTSLDYAHAIGSSNITWWLQKQIEADDETETFAVSSLGYSKNNYYASGINCINRARNFNFRETTWIRKSIDDGQIELHFMDDDGNTMLHSAMESKNYDTVEVLIQRGALLTARNYKNVTPYDIAVQSNDEDLMALIGSNINATQIDNRAASYLYKMLLSFIAQTVQLGAIPEESPENSRGNLENMDKKIQSRRLKAIQFVSNLLIKGIPHDPIGDCSRYLLPLAITTNNRTLLPILLAAGMPLTTSDSGLGIVQLSWLTPDLTTWTGMVVTRAVINQLQYEYECFKLSEAQEDMTAQSTSCTELLSDLIYALIQQLKGDKPWEAQFQNYDDISTVTEYFVTACKYGATLSAWYIWIAGGCNFHRTTPTGCTALEAALSSGQTTTAMRLVLDMEANPFLKNSKGEEPIHDYLERNRLLEILLGREFRSLEKAVEKAKESRDKKNFQQIILVFIILFLQNKSSKHETFWKLFVDLILEMYFQVQKDVERELKENENDPKAKNPLESSEWMVALLENLFEVNANGITLRSVEYYNPLDITKVCKDNLEDFSKEYHFEDANDNFYDLFFTLKYNFDSIDIPINEEFKSKSKKNFLLDKAFKECCEKPYPLFMHLLITLAKRDVNCILDEVCKTRPLHHAARNGNCSAIAYLLQCSASPSVIDRSGFQPYQYAFMYGHKRAGYILLEHMRNNGDEIESGENFLKMHECYLKMYGLDPAKNNNSRYTLVDNEKKLIENRLSCIKKVWKNKDIKEAAEKSLVNYDGGEAFEIKESVTELLKSLKDRICKKKELFDGDIDFVGSSEDNVRLYCPDEYDCNLVLKNISAYPGKGLKASMVSLDEARTIYCGHSQSLEVYPVEEEMKNFMKGRNFLNEFYSLARQSIIEMDLDKNPLKIMIPGIRPTQVGIGLNFCWFGKEYPMLFVDIDFVPTVRAPWPLNLPKPEKCSLDTCDLEEVYLNIVGEDEWRLSFGHTETKIMRNLSREKRDVYVACKMVLSFFKTESWVPSKLRKDFMYWDSRMFSLPSKGGFALKNCFFRELEEVTNDEHWANEYYIRRVCSVFERMCEIGEPPSPNIIEERAASIHEIQPRLASIQGTKPVKAYFGGDTEKASIFLCAPEILKFLRTIRSLIADESQTPQCSSSSSNIAQ